MKFLFGTGRIKDKSDKVITRVNDLRSARGNIEKVCVIYYIPKDQNEKYNNWSDGFVKGVKLLAKEYEVEWFNLYDYKPSKSELEQYDLVIFKSCWNWIVDNYRNELGSLSSLCAIMVSCSLKPSLKRLFSYDYIYYETEFYKRLIPPHPFMFQVFGIDGDVFSPQKTEKEIDVLSIGAFKSYKRFHLMNKLKGKKVIIGNTNTKEFNRISRRIKDVEIINYSSQVELSKIINKSKLVYIPADINGGGERAVLEARACNVPVQVEPDNEKLTSLVKGPILTHRNVYEGIKESIHCFNQN